MLGSWLKAHGVIIGAILIGLGLFLWRLTTLPVAGKLSHAEIQTLQTTGSWHEIIAHAAFMPYFAAERLSQLLIPHHPVFAIRLPSVLFALVAILALLYVIRRWYGQRTTLLALFLLTCSAGLLHLGRLGVSDITFVTAISLLLAVHASMQHCNGRSKIVAGWLVACALALYIPGMVWFVGFEVWWQRKRLKSFWQQAGWSRRIILSIGSLVVVAPLIYSLVRHFTGTSLLTLAGLPSSWPGFIEIGKNAAAVILFTILRTPADPVRWLGHTPLFAAFMAVGFVAGLLFYGLHWRSERSHHLAIYSLLTFLLIAAGGPVTRALALPLVYIIALGGIAYLLHTWLRRFPKNPVARQVGILLITVATVLTCAYNLRHYFVAWPHSSDTRAVFEVKPPRTD